MSGPTGGVEVRVEHRWRGEATFEFEDEAAAQRFRDRVAANGDDGLAALVEAGDVDSGFTELVDFEVIA